MSLIIFKPRTRYFICFSYIGTRYWGVQRQVAARSLEKDNTIQSAIETAINLSVNPRPLNVPVSSVVSSRTDRLVHASENFMVCDLYHPVAGKTYDQDYVCDAVNEWLYKNDHLITVKKIVQIPRGYHVRRYAKEREYIMRVLYHPKFQGEQDQKLYYDLCATYDLNRISIVHIPKNSSPLDINKVQESIDLMSGLHDFRSFEAFSRTKKKDRNSIETISKFTVSQVETRNISRSNEEDDPDVMLLDFVVRSESFLYKQVRRMVGLSLTVGLGNASLDEVKYLLENPSRDNWIADRYITAYPAGLYLRGIGFGGINC